MVGFTDQDSYHDVLLRASRGLGLKCNINELQLICSGGMVLDSLINDQPWTLGEFIQQNGGNQNGSKRVWGVHIPIGLEEAEAGPSTRDSVNISRHIELKIIIICIYACRDALMTGDHLLVQLHVAGSVPVALSLHLSRLQVVIICLLVGV